MRGNHTLHTECPECGSSKYQSLGIEGSKMYCRCEKCGCGYESEEEEHEGFFTYNSVKTSEPSKARCPMCMYWVSKEELKGNGGICNGCEDRRV